MKEDATHASLIAVIRDLTAELRVLRREKMAAEALLRDETLNNQFRRYQDLVITRERENKALIAYLRSSELATTPGVETVLFQ